ncbi:MAG: hypothetical protein JST80_03060 [Bdellovibrionales bacterium]|nr:hypothetical protein [Bdellovibrionales bacterium]
MAAKKGKLRISNRYQEIVTLLQKAKDGSGNFLWKVVRDEFGERRHKYSLHIKKVDSDSGHITIEVNDHATRELSPGDKVYFKLMSRNSAFKATVVRTGTRTVVTSFPEEVAVTELRELKRYYFHPADEKFVQVRRLKDKAHEKNERIYNILVCDISQGGLCLFLTENQQSQLEANQKIKLEMLGPYRLENSITGEVTFKMDYKIKDVLGYRPGYKVGVKLDSRIPLATFERFIVKKQALSVSDERLVLDEGFRAKVHENMNEIRTALRKNKRLDKFFEGLAVAKAGNQYLRQHIEMLCEVLCGLAVRLGWISERSIDKLIYVAFLHDVRFSQYPKLAQIQSVKEFNAQSLYLSENEHKAFFEAPLYASELARQDLEAYPDAIKILLQQKELPDGSGFPHGLTSVQLAPLSCLFITAHYFVDYVIDHPDWSMEDFVKTYQKKFKGQYFQKIFEMLR